MLVGKKCAKKKNFHDICEVEAKNNNNVVIKNNLWCKELDIYNNNLLIF